MSIGKRLRSWRKEMNLTTTQIHEATGVSLGALSNYENDRREINSDLLIQLYEKFNLDIVYILTGSRDERRLTNEQEQFLYYFNLCDMETKALIIKLLKRFTKDGEKQEEYLKRQSNETFRQGSNYEEHQITAIDQVAEVSGLTV